MKINSFKYYIIDALKSLKRNSAISLASAVTVTATMVILGVFILLMQNVNLGMSDLESKIQVQVFLKDNTSAADQENIVQKLNEISGVKNFEFEDKSKALEKFSKQISKDDTTLLNNYDASNNPLPNSYIVNLENPEASKQVISSLENLQGVEYIGNDKDFTDKIISISKSVKWIGIALSIIMASVSVFLISNTIKLAIYSRKKEIGIMKLVGATDWFIRWPFVIEGAVMGLVGTIIANTLLYYIYKTAFIKINENLIFANLLPPSYVTQTLHWHLLLVGILVGGLGSSWSLYKFLKV